MLNGRINKCGVISPRFDVSLNQVRLDLELPELKLKRE